ncbi:MAG: flagellar motor switch protein FliM [Epulopiscium sp. Nuni2H_MBin003]|nr:MAG: flagellar motor switch protein FliM [Epulopiscium sp. Nuni2H_MBin003]
MSELLSQEEIDALFASLNSGEIDVNEIKEQENKVVIKEYNFARPTKFSREHLRTLELMGENYARLVSQYLSGMMRTLVPIKIESSEAITFSDFTSALSNPVALAIIEPNPLPSNILFELSTNICYAFLDRLLGGEGGELEAIREFTTIELIILNKAFTRLVDLMREPWENVVELRPYLGKVETNPQILNMIPPNEMVALLTFSIQFGDVDGLMNLCMPYTTLEPIITKLNTSYQFGQNEDDEREKDKNVEDILRRANIPIRAILGKTHVTVKEFLDLQVNDIIKLDREIDDDIDLYIGNVLKFKGAPGIFKSRSAIQIKEIIAKEDE